MSARESELIIIRHGETNYTNEFPDLTEKGKTQVAETALSLKDHIEKFDRIVALSSPAQRALGSAAVLLEALDPPEHVPVRKVGTLACFKILDAERFLAYMDTNATQIYGEHWLTDPVFALENGFVEPRPSVERRAGMFLARYGAAIQRIGEERGMAIVAPTTTHFEIGNVALGVALSPNPGPFPIAEHPVLQHGEAVRVGLGQAKEGIFTVSARGQTRTARYDLATSQFTDV